MERWKGRKVKRWKSQNTNHKTQEEEIFRLQASGFRRNMGEVKSHKSKVKGQRSKVKGERQTVQKHGHLLLVGSRMRQRACRDVRFARPRTCHRHVPTQIKAFRTV